MRQTDEYVAETRKLADRGDIGAQEAINDLHESGDHRGCLGKGNLCALHLTVKKTTVFNGTGALRPFSNHYATIGPDGTRFTNSSLAELKRVIARKYGIRQNRIVLDII